MQREARKNQLEKSQGQKHGHSKMKCPTPTHQTRFRRLEEPVVTIVYISIMVAYTMNTNIIYTHIPGKEKQGRGSTQAAGLVHTWEHRLTAHKTMAGVTRKGGEVFRRAVRGLAASLTVLVGSVSRMDFDTGNSFCGLKHPRARSERRNKLARIVGRQRRGALSGI